jgi:transposase
MGKGDMREFIKAEREQSFLLPPSIDDWLEENHMARFIVGIIDQLDLTAIYEDYGPRGSRPMDPKVMLGLLFYAYSTGVFSSRKIERATYDSIAFRFIAGNLHPDHDTVNSFRNRFKKHIEDLFRQVLLTAAEMGVLNIGNVSVDGTKIKANASKHKAVSYAHAEKLEARIKEEVDTLMKLADESESASETGLEVPDELARRESRLAKIREARAVIEERARQRAERNAEDYDRKMKERARKDKEGKKTRGPVPQPPDPAPLDKDQYNFTDPESRIMKTGDGFQQCYNAQAAVDHESRLIVGITLSASPNDKNELLPTLDAIPAGVGKPAICCADAGYISATNVKGANERGVEPLIAPGREIHNSFLERWLEPAENPPAPDDSEMERMLKKMQSEEGRSVYRFRKMTVETVFGVIKQVMGFRRFSLRGLENAAYEWALVSLAYNMKRLHTMAGHRG